MAVFTSVFFVAALIVAGPIVPGYLFGVGVLALCVSIGAAVRGVRA